MCGGGHHHDDSTGTSAPTNATEPAAATTTSSFPDHLYAHLRDAHCHIQDDRQNIHHLVQSWAGKIEDEQAVMPLLAGKVCLMGVQPSQDLGIDCSTDQGEHDEQQHYNTDGAIRLTTAALAYSSPSASDTASSSLSSVVTATWNDTDTRGDWDVVSMLAKEYPERFVPCFGIHPWFTHKYRPLEQNGQATERMADMDLNQSPSTSLPGTPEAPPSLSFSSAFLTPVPGPGVRKEAFLAMSKQLQEQMAKESKEREAAAAAATATEGGSKDEGHADEVSHNVKEDEGSLVSTAKEDGMQDGGPDMIQLSSHHQHQDQDSSLSHYQKVLSLPSSAPETYMAELSVRLPKPRSLEPALKELRRQLEAHPKAVLGEIGLDRTARVPEPSSTTGNAVHTDPSSAPWTSNGQKKTTLALTSIQHQLEVVREQLKLAASLDRPVSFHCVQAYGHWHDFLIQEGRRLKQIEADQGYQLQMQQIHGPGVVLPALPPGGIRLSKRGAARLKREAKEAEWERHVASTLQDTSDEEDDDSDEESESKDGDGASDDSVEAVSPVMASTPVPAPMIPLTIPEVSAPTTPAAGAAAATTTGQLPVASYEPVLPPRLCMHSYGGSVDMLRAFIKLDHPPEMYFSFSILINGRLQERKLNELILAVPEDRLLIESDHHSHGQVDQLLGEMVKRVSQVRKWTVEETVEKTGRNWRRFVYGTEEEEQV